MHLEMRTNAGKLTKLDKQEELTKDFMEENQDPISMFYNWLIDEWKSVDKMCDAINGNTTDEVYSKYKKWCEDSGMPVEKTNTFTLRFSRLLPSYMKKKVMSIGGAKYNCYTKLK